MRALNKLFFCLLGLVWGLFAQAHQISIKSDSNQYDVVIEMDCESTECSGAAEITFYKKNTENSLGKIKLDNFSIFLNKYEMISENVIHIYGEQNELIFDDFNFDGYQDVAIFSGNNGPYGGPVFDVYVFNISKNKLVMSEELSRLTQENLGMFQVDQVKKIITTFSKGSCCQHTQSEYKVVPKRGLVLVREVYEYATGGDDGMVEVTESNLIKGKWHTTVKEIPVKIYYK